MGARSLSLLGLAWLVAGSSLVLAAEAIDEGDGWPVLGALIVVSLAGAELVSLLWFRQMPVAPNDLARYRTIVLIKLAAAAAIALVGFALAVTVGPWWLAALGVGLSVPALALAWPSAADRERHELLYLV